MVAKSLVTYGGDQSISYRQEQGKRGSDMALFMWIDKMMGAEALGD